MKTVAAIVLGGLLLVPGVAMASSATDAALGLGAFAVFNQILSGTGIFGGVVARPVVVAPQPVVLTPPPPPVVLAPAPVVVTPAPVVVAPRPIFVAPRPVVVVPRPVIVGPPVYAPVPVYRDHIYHRAYGHRWGWDHRYDQRH
jgi:hypothetical protein